MAYIICAYIAQIPTLEALAQRYQNAAVVPLKQGFGLIPLTDDLRQEIHGDSGDPADKINWDDVDPLHEFYRLTTALTEIGITASQSSAVAYIEAEFFGGDGAQAAIAWHKGEVVAGPLFSGGISAISPVLHEIGVENDSPHVEFYYDEFHALGLRKYRHTAEWLTEIGR